MFILSMRKVEHIWALALCVLLCIPGNAQVLNFYYGNLHAHSSYSDGNKDSAITLASTPFHDYQFAKTAMHFDFLGISEHNHSGAGMRRVDYAKGLTQADSANQNGIFVAMYGMEWGVIGPPGGHVLIYGVNQLIGWDSVSGAPNYDIYNAKLDYDGLFTKIARTPGAFACFAHPDNTDYSSLFTTAVNPTYDSAIAGTAIRSGPAFSTDTVYSDPSTSSYEARYKDALKRGYHLGATLDHDNHYTTFGKMAASRTVVLAPSLTRTDITNAIRQMHTQASDDWNVQVTFTINGHVLGSEFNDTINPAISVSVYDPDMEAITSINILHGVPGSGSNPTSLTSSSSSTLAYTHSITTGSSHYYYAVITQADGNKVFTSPIWVNKVSVLPVKLVFFTAAKSREGVLCKWRTAAELNADYFEVERSTDEVQWQSAAMVKAKGNSNAPQDYTATDFDAELKQTTYYRLKQVDYNGAVAYSNIAVVTGTEQKPVVTLSPNPFNEALVLSLENMQDEYVFVEWFNSSGKLLHTAQVRNINGNEVTLDQPSDLPQGLYDIRISAAGTSISKRVLKVN
jgi:hypothetical protein